MPCHTPGCTGDHQAQRISHTVVYRERTLTIHNVPADLCPECGDAVLAAETLFHIDGLLGRKAGRSKRDSFVYEA